ncbi:xanthine dehydrogenase family protein molybdopterin-binding subunit [Marinibaculum pumilum]|uniref:Xanthine dehydrogenase family protein molybdopterin-binding subunit n=1 Tax=Marinibaculum pumilum TaxID=1766165 RepID=A0ABV7L3A9_9PROT
MRHERDLMKPLAPLPAGRPGDEWAMAAGIGAPLRRLEDERLLRGRGSFTADLAAGSGALAMAVVRSPHAHAAIEGIDPAAALRLPGMVGVLTAADLDRQGIADLPCDWVPPGMTAAPLHPVLARDRVLYAGQPVAAVFARSAAAALDGAEAMAVRYRPYPVLADQEAALAPGAAALHREAPGNLAYRFWREGGRPAAAIAAAPVQLRRRYRNNRLAPAPMEGRAVLSTYDPAARRLTHVTGSQLPHVHARALADCLGLPMHRLDLRAPDVGGGFGAKLCFYPEDVLAAVAAMRFGTAIRWEESRSEGFLATTHGRDHLQEVVLAADRDGRIRGLQARLTADLGAYAIGMGPGVPAINAGLSVSGPYRIDDLSVEVVGVYSNRTPTGPYRGAGHPEATYLIERAVDDLAAELGLDPVELRRRNMFPPRALPRRLPIGFALDGGDFAATMDRVLAMGRDAGLAARRAAAPVGHARGIGLAVYSELSGAAPSMGKGAVGFRRAGHESARLVMHPDGRVTLFSGTHSQGQGHATALAQIAAQVLQVPEADIAVVQGEAGRIPFGTGTYNSRSMAVGGAAVHRAARLVLARARRIAAGRLGCRPRDLAYRDGRFIAPSGPAAVLRRGAAALGRRVKGQVFRRLTGLALPPATMPGPGAEIAMAEVARLAHLGHDLPLGMAPGLEAVASFDPRGMPAANGAHLALVDVDLESGQVRLLEHLAAEDCGTVINPLLAAGQVHGGIAQGAGQALMEAMVHDPEGQPLSGSFGDYAVPRAADLPAFGTGHVVTPSRLNPLGARGIGEGGAIGAPPAIVNAVLDALRAHGVTALDMPLSPERIWRALQAAADGEAGADGE